MTTRIYVANLGDDVTTEDVETWFARHGRVASTELFSDLTGRGGGFAFVEMSSADAARRAIAALDGTAQGSRTLSVKEVPAAEEEVAGQSR
jgi:RNA recognition motif-containing protein